MQATIPTLQMSEISKIRHNEMYNQMYVPLSIYSKVSAQLINMVLHWMCKNCEPKMYYKRSRYATANAYDPSDKIGGGILVKGNPDVIASPTNEYGLHFKAAYRVISGTKGASNERERFSSVKQKLAWKLKEYWRARAAASRLPETEYVLKVYDNACDGSRSFDDESVQPSGTVSFSEYRALYEALQERSMAKTVSAYGQDAVNKMIGKPMEDQFVLASIEMIEKQIHQLQEQLTAEREKLAQERRDEVRRIEQLYSNKDDELSEQFKAQIEQLKQQLNEAAALGKTAC